MRSRAVALLALLALAGLAGCTAPTDGANGSGSSTAASSPPAPVVDCTAHRHATFAVFVPGPDGMRRLDMAAPKDSRGYAYYQLGIARNMTVAIHMHQAGSEQGSTDLAVSQMHYESPGACGTIAGSLAAIDVHADANGLTIAGQHGPVGQGGRWVTNSTHAVHLYTRPVDESCAWSERPLSALDEGVPDGLSFLVAFGSPTAAQATSMQAAVPHPMGHEVCE
jgi:hypothetical protein